MLDIIIVEYDPHGKVMNRDRLYLDVEQLQRLFTSKLCPATAHYDPVRVTLDIALPYVPKE